MSVALVRLGRARAARGSRPTHPPPDFFLCGGLCPPTPPLASLPTPCALGACVAPLRAGVRASSRAPLICARVGAPRSGAPRRPRYPRACSGGAGPALIRRGVGAQPPHQETVRGGWVGSRVQRVLVRRTRGLRASSRVPLPGCVSVHHDPAPRGALRYPRGSGADPAGCGAQPPHQETVRAGGWGAARSACSSDARAGTRAARASERREEGAGKKGPKRSSPQLRRSKRRGGCTNRCLCPGLQLGRGGFVEVPDPFFVAQHRELARTCPHDHLSIARVFLPVVARVI